jgi:peptidyl-prolyl cis-trans isomerase SurA
MRVETLNNCLKALFLATLVAVQLGLPSEGYAQSIVVIVNDEPITSFDIQQRMRWNALTRNFGDQMKTMLSGESVKRKFQRLMMAANPQSQQEAMAAAERIKKRIVEDARRQVLSRGGGTSRKAVIDELIEDKLKVQASKTLKVKVSDREVEEAIEKRVGGGGADKKGKVQAFYKQFESNGVSRRTIKEVFRAQLAWRNVIGRKYGQRIAAMIASLSDTGTEGEKGDVHYDVKILRLAIKDTSDQKAIGQRMLEAENLKGKFSSCAQLPKAAKLVANASVKSMNKAKLAAFPKDVQPLLERVSEGQMTPPVLVGRAVESYAVCRKMVAVKKKSVTAAAKPDPRQAEYERFSRSYLQDLKQKAMIDFRGS